MPWEFPSNVEKVAVFSDIHSNYQAFAACYRDALSQGVQGFIFLGDYVSDLADARKTMDLVYQIRKDHPTVCLRGNREQYMLDCCAGTASFSPGSKSGSLLYTYHSLRETDLAFFARLPIWDRGFLGGHPLEIAHAVRGNDRFYFDLEDGNLSAVFPSMEYPLLLTGHSHKQYQITSQGKTVCNPGSVGLPHNNEYLAQYGIVTVAEGLSCSLRRVRYDIRAAIRSQFESGLTAQGKCWAISILYDIITGQEITMQLLHRVSRLGETALYDEAAWQQAAGQMGLQFSLPEILEYCETYCGNILYL